MGADDSQVLPEHYEPIGKAQTLAQWRKRMRMPVPTLAGGIVDLVIEKIYETTSMNRLPLDLLIEAHCTVDDPPRNLLLEKIIIISGYS